MPTTIERLRIILTTRFSVPAEKVQGDAAFDMLGLDSLDLIELLFEVEEEFDIRAPQEGGLPFRTATVQDIVDGIDRALATTVPQAVDA